MYKMVIERSAPLNGLVKVSGAKNAALPEIASTLLAGGGWHRLSNIPGLKDIDTLKRIMEGFGVSFSSDTDGILKIFTGNLNSYEAPYDLVKTMRASILLLGPLLARYGKARISLPGGCAIGERPVNLHLDALSAMGASITLDGGYIDAKVNGRLKGTDFFFDIVTVTGTENIMMAAVTAEGKTILRNAALEPEVTDLAKMLISMGADIEGAGTDTIIIKGVPELKPASHAVIPDRIETGTFMIAAALTGGKVIITNSEPEHSKALIVKLEQAGADIKVKGDSIEVCGKDKIESVDIKTAPYPGFATDLQAQFMTLMCLADGWSMLRETVFENRFIHVSELRRMGADIEINGNQALVRGKKRLLSAPVMATDLRASASLVLAGLVAEGGRTEIHRIYHLDRGYENLEEKFSRLGAKIWREDE